MLTDANELNAAVERLRQYGDGMKRFPPYHGGEHCLQRDLRIVADAYLALGTRQPDKMRVYRGGIVLSGDADPDFRAELTRLNPDAKLMRVATFIQEIPEVPNAE